MNTNYRFSKFVSILVVLGLMLSNTGSVSFAQEGVAPVPEPASTGSTTGSVPVEGQAWSQSGWFSVVWGDGAQSASVMEYTLTDDSLQTIGLLLDETLAQSLGGVLSLDRKYVNVQGVWTAPLSNQSASTIVNVTSISLAPSPGTESPNGDALPAVTGSKPWISIMCRFNDYSVEPKNLAYFQGMYSSTYPGLDHYWRELSYASANVAGSNASGWFVLPHSEAYYNSTDTLGGTDLDLLAADCTAAADANVNFASYRTGGINMMFNTDFDNGYAWGGSKYMTLDGVGQVWSVTWEPPWGYSSIAVISHEMGHGFGLPHSSGAYGQTYDNQWDIMSDSWANCSRVTHATYGCLGQHTISYHKDKLGWIPASQKYTAGLNTNINLTLEQLALPTTGNYKMVQIPISGSSTHFYTVEVRRQTGYDYKLPGQAVIIHEIDTTRSRPAYVIDADGNGNTGDAGAMWTVGEVFSDTTNKIFVSVLSSSSTGFQVNIKNNSSPITIYGSAGVGAVTLSYIDGTVKTVISDGSGNYYITVPSGWSGTVTPSRTGYTFSPVNKSYTNVTANQIQNYTATLNPYAPVIRWTSAFDLSHGWTVKDYLRTVGDVNKDGRADLIGFGQDGVYVALSTGTGFGTISKWASAFDSSHGWTSDFVRTVGDVNNDQRADLIGFGQDGVYVALSTGIGFGAISKWASAFDASHGWTVKDYVRTVGDVNNDKRADLIGFGQDGVYVALSTGTGFGAISKWASAFDASHGWTVQGSVRTVGDVNKDGRADLIGFGLDGVYVALSTGTGFGVISKWTSALDLSHGWTVSDFVRTVGDVNNDGRADLIGFGLDGVYVALSTGSGFGAISRWTDDFDLSRGWTVKDFVRTAGDVNLDGKVDLVGFGLDGVYVAIAR